MDTERVIKLIVNKAYEARSHFVVECLESVYKKVLLIELRETGSIVEEEVEIPATYKGHVIGVFRVDVAVDKHVIIELKTVTQLLPAHAIQSINYPPVSGIDNGLLISFGSTKRLEIKRKYRVYNPHNQKINRTRAR